MREGRYGCLLLSVGLNGLPTYGPSALGTIELGLGSTYRALSFPGDGRYTYDAARGWVVFQGGSLADVSAAFRRLEDGTPVLRFGEALRDPAPEVEIGESVCRGGG